MRVEAPPFGDSSGFKLGHMHERLAPPADMAFARLLEDLAERGLLNEMMFLCMHEVGRSRGSPLMASDGTPSGPGSHDRRCVPMRRLSGISGSSHFFDRVGE